MVHPRGSAWLAKASDWASAERLGFNAGWLADGATDIVVAMQRFEAPWHQIKDAHTVFTVHSMRNTLRSVYSSQPAQEKSLSAQPLQVRSGPDGSSNDASPEMMPTALAKKRLEHGWPSDHSANLNPTFPSLGYKNSTKQCVAAVSKALGTYNRPVFSFPAPAILLARVDLYTQAATSLPKSCFGGPAIPVSPKLMVTRRGWLLDECLPPILVAVFMSI